MKAVRQQPTPKASSAPQRTDKPGILTDAVSAAVSRFGRLGVYLASLLALLVGLKKLREPVETLFGSHDPKLVFVVAAIPLFVLVLTDALPAVFRRRTEKRLRDWGLHGGLKDPGFFRAFCQSTQHGR